MDNRTEEFVSVRAWLREFLRLGHEQRVVVGRCVVLSVRLLTLLLLPLIAYEFLDYSRPYDCYEGIDVGCDDPYNPGGFSFVLIFFLLGFASAAIFYRSNPPMRFFSILFIFPVLPLVLATADLASKSDQLEFVAVFTSIGAVVACVLFVLMLIPESELGKGWR